MKFYKKLVQINEILVQINEILVQINEILVQINTFITFHAEFLQTYSTFNSNTKLVNHVQLIKYSLIISCLDTMRFTIYPHKIFAKRIYEAAIL